MSKVIDLTGQKFGRLTVIERAGNKRKEAAWKCKCDCGKIIVVGAYKLKHGKKSCGCARSESKKTHGMSHTRLHNIWCDIRKRCNNSHCKTYKYYGGRGIKMCEEWENSFEAFYAWALQSGYNDSLSIDRKDNNKGYSPDNCKWATIIEQANNKRNNHMIEYNGKIQTMKQWADELGISYYKLANRLNQLHWSIERALSTP